MGFRLADARVEKRISTVTIVRLPLSILWVASKIPVRGFEDKVGRFLIVMGWNVIFWKDFKIAVPISMRSEERHALECGSRRSCSTGDAGWQGAMVGMLNRADCGSQRQCSQQIGTWKHDVGATVETEGVWARAPATWTFFRSF